MVRRTNGMMSRRSMLAGSIGTVFAAGAVAIPASCSGQVYPGARVHGVDISGNTAAGGEALLRDALGPFEERAVTYIFEDTSWEASLAELGATVDYATMVEMAMEHGRDGSVFDRYASLIAGNSERDIPLILERDDSTLRAFLTALDPDISVDPQNARLEMQNDQVVVIDSVPGRRLDVDQAVIDTIEVLDGGESATVELTTLPVEAEVTASDLAGAREDAVRLVREAVTFTHNGQRYPVDAATLAGALVIEQGQEARLDAAKLDERLDVITNAVYVPAQNVKLGWDNGLYVVEGDVDGQRVDRNALEQAVSELAQSSERAAPLPIAPVKADARADNINELGIEGHIAYGSSSFIGSSQARAANVAVSAQNISYKLVAPGELFSFNDLLGSITTENGFVEGTIIEGDFVSTDIGGGVCQVSTTVFRAAANAGFRFTEWHPHTWRLGFYEADGSPPGLDGAIYQSSDWELDLVFENPLDSWLLLMMVVDQGTVYAHLYGKSAGWITTLGEPRMGAPKPIPAPVERVNHNLAPGERRMVQQAAAGVTVSIRRTVTAADGSVVSDGDFVSDYQSVPETWEVGPA